MKNPLVRFACYATLCCAAVVVSPETAAAQAQCLDAPQRCEQVTGRRVLGLRPNNPTNYCATTDALPSATHCVNDEYFMGGEGTAFTGVTQVNCSGHGMTRRCSSRSSAGHVSSTSSRSSRLLRAQLQDVKRQLAIFIARQLVAEHRLDEHGRRLDNLEAVNRLWASQIAELTESAIALAYDEDDEAGLSELENAALRLPGEHDDILASERVGALITGRNRDLRRMIVSIGRNNGRAGGALGLFVAVHNVGNQVAVVAGVRGGYETYLSDDGDTVLTLTGLLGVGSQANVTSTVWSAGAEATVLRMVADGPFGIGGGLHFAVDGTMGESSTTNVTGLTYFGGGAHINLRLRTNNRRFNADAVIGPDYAKGVSDAGTSIGLGVSGRLQATFVF